MADYDFLIKTLTEVRTEMAALVHPPFPGTPAVSDWPCENPGDRECLDAAWHKIEGALALHRRKEAIGNSTSKPRLDTEPPIKSWENAPVKVKTAFMDALLNAVPHGTIEEKFNAICKALSGATP